MPAVKGELVHPLARAEWRVWLEANHARQEGAWLVTYKKATGKPRVEYDAAVEEALCFGWVDSKPPKLDEEWTLLDEVETLTVPPDLAAALPPAAENFEGFAAPPEPGTWPRIVKQVTYDHQGSVVISGIDDHDKPWQELFAGGEPRGMVDQAALRRAPLWPPQQALQPEEETGTAGGLTTSKHPQEVPPPPGSTPSTVGIISDRRRPAARFTRRLVALIESGYGLECAPLTDEWRLG